MDLIINLSDDYQKHKNIGNKLSEKEIEKIEQKLNLELPESYKLFLKYFGDGADLVYNTSILKSNNTTFLSDQYKNFQEDIETSEGIIKSSSLLALTKQNKDKEAWYWLTNDDIDEWSLVYFSAKEKSIIHTIEDFSKWLELLVKGKNNVITEIGKQSGGNSNNEAVTLNYLE